MSLALIARDETLLGGTMSACPPEACRSLGGGLRNKSLEPPISRILSLPTVTPPPLLSFTESINHETCDEYAQACELFFGARGLSHGGRTPLGVLSLPHFAGEPAIAELQVTICTGVR